jgi:hypothetical protein
MRKTAKYTAGLKKAQDLKLKLAMEHDALYKGLQEAGYHWDSDSQKWEEGKPQSTSMFASDDDDTPSGVVRLRVMAHPKEIAQVVTLAKKTPGMRCIDVSGEYPNRRGIGVRVYLTFVMDQ